MRRATRDDERAEQRQRGDHQPRAVLLDVAKQIGAAERAVLRVLDLRIEVDWDDPPTEVAS